MMVRINPALEVLASDNYQGPLSVVDSRIDQTGKVNSSSILAQIRIDTEFIQWNPNTGREFFANYYQKAINNIQLSLTDKHNRYFYTFPGANLLYPTGSTNQDTAQSFTGNFHFTATIRVDILENDITSTTKANVPGTAAVGVNKLFNPPTTDVPARFENLLIHQKFGKDQYGKGPGF